MNSWTIVYEDGENVLTARATGKLSLDPAWVFVIDMTTTPPAIALAIPQQRVINVQLDSDD